MDRFVLSVLVENKAGVLSRVSGLFSRRGYNIDSLTVCETHNPNQSRMTIVVRGDEYILEQIQKQLLDCLKKSGLEEIEAEGVFDPNMHDAVMRDEDDSDAESGTITAVLQKGYRVKGKIIRHTMVKVKS